MNKQLFVLCVLGAVGASLLGCAPPEPGDPDQPAALEDTAEAAQAISYNTWNYTCAESLSVRSSPGGAPDGTILTKYTVVHAYYPPSGAWADVQVCGFGAGAPCGGHRGWVLKDYVSQNCN
jgi:hypothetical protein